MKSAVVGCLLALMLASRASRAENPNPFGGAPGAPGAPPAPTDGNDFQDEDDFVNPGQNFGFNPPGNLQPPPPPPDSNNAPQPSNPGAVPPAGVPPGKPFAGGNRPPPPATAPGALPPAQRNSGSPPRTATTPGATAADGGKASATKAAPKLADYLELDSSVKGLEVKNFDLPDKDIKDVVTLISKWTGKNFILDNKVRGKITILGPSQVTLQEAYQAFLSALDANGLTTVQSGKFIRIIESAEARRAPVETYSGDYAPNTDQFITRIFQLKYINSDEVQREFRNLTTRQGKLFAYEPTNSIIITDTGSNIRRIEGILQVLDVKNFESTLHVLKIKHTSAKAISDMLGEIYGEGKGGAAGRTQTFRRSALERTRGGGIISKIIPDEATNSLVVLANSAGFLQLVQLVAKLDVKVTDTGRIHVYYCEYAKAEDLAATLASLAGGGKGGSGQSGQRRTQVQTPNGAPAAGVGAAPAGANGPVTAELEGGVKITSDAATNALVITANASDYQTIKRVIRKLDIPRLQVFVETAILEISVDTNTKLGVNVAIGAPNKGFAGGFIGDSASLISAVTSGIPGEGATIPIFAGPSFNANIQNPAAGGSTTSTVPITVTSFMGLLNLLTKATNTSVLSTPQIIALDNEKAEFKVLDEIPVQTSFTALSAGATTPSGTATGSIDRLKTGIEIKLTPHVNAASRTIRLEIDQKVDSTKANTSVPSALQSVQVATTSRITTTSVVVRDQDFVMLGGLMSDKIDDTVSKMPLLGDIPVIGWLFKSTTYHAVKTNLVILLHPRIIGTSLDAANVIDEQLKIRQGFIEKNLGGDDEFEDESRDYRGKIRDQQKQSKGVTPFDYRNNNDDDLDKSKPLSRQESELDTAAPKGREETGAAGVAGKDNNPNSPLLPPGADQGAPPQEFIPPPPPPDAGPPPGG